MEDLIDSIVNEAQKMRKDDFQDQKAFDFLFAMQVLLDTAKLLNDERKEMIKGHLEKPPISRKSAT